MKSGRGCAADTADDPRAKGRPADAQDVGLDTGGDQSDFGFEELGYPRGGVQGDARPTLPGVAFVDAVWSRKSRAALAPSTSKRSVEEVR